jgi:hypothetical protein
MVSSRKQVRELCALPYYIKAEAVETSERLIRGLGIETGAKVLDIGCGTGLIIPWLLDAVGEGGSVTDKERAAVEMFRILKPGGRVAICHNESREVINALHHDTGGNVDMDMLLDGSEMTAMFSRAGFGEISIMDSLDSYLLRAYKPT